VAYMYTHVTPSDLIWGHQGQGQTWFKVVTKVTQYAEVSVVHCHHFEVITEMDTITKIIYEYYNFQKF